MINIKRGEEEIMPHIFNNNVQIYFKTEGDSSNPPLLLLHWFMGSHQTWYDIGWVRVLKTHFYLILVDHRGYGASSKPHEPEAYKIQNHVNDMVAILDHLEIEKTHIFGYSMGGRIGYGMMAFAPDRLDHIILGGMHPYSSDKIPTDLDQRIELLNQGMEQTLRTYGIGPKEVFDRMAQNDAQALLADTRQTKKWKGLEEQVQDCDNPVLLFVGKEDGFYDGMREIASTLSNAHFVAFPSENHRSAFLKRTLLLPHISRFLNTKIQ